MHGGFLRVVEVFGLKVWREKRVEWNGSRGWEFGRDM